jgi:hypothetical protein
MANAPTSTKRRRPGRKAEDIHLVWKEQAPNAVFAGKSLTDLETALDAVQEAGREIAKLTKARSAALKVRGERVAALTPLLRNIVKGVQGHPEYGEDSPLYRAMGFVPFSERGSGLTRRPKGGKGEASSSTAGNEKTAA